MNKINTDNLGGQVDAASKWLDAAMSYVVTYGFQIAGALVFLLIGLKVSSWMAGRISAALEKRTVDVTLARFIGNIAKVVAIVFMVIITLGNFGVSIAPLIALAGAGAFGVTVAIQGPLSNYGAGVSIILSRPFTVGNTITIAKVCSGVVENITLANTVLIGEDGERITIPNKEIVGKVIVNSETRRIVQTKIAIADGQDTDIALAALRKAISEVGAVDAATEPQIGIHDFAYGGVVLGLRFWVPSSRYFETRYAVNQRALAELRAASIRLMPGATAAVTAPSLSADDDETIEDKVL